MPNPSKASELFTHQPLSFARSCHARLSSGNVVLMKTSRSSVHLFFGRACFLRVATLLWSCGFQVVATLLHLAFPVAHRLSAHLHFFLRHFTHHCITPNFSHCASACSAVRFKKSGHASKASASSESSFPSSPFGLP